MKARKIFWSLWILAVACWLMYLAIGFRLAHILAARFGGTILRGVKGKISPEAVSVFIQYRMKEALLLATLALFFITLHGLFENWRRAQKRFPKTGWAIHGLAGFLFLNAWTGVAATTALYWGILGAGIGVQNLMQFQLKRILMAENPNHHRAVLMGNSQTRAQIDEDQLNARIGDHLWTTELHWPGSQAFDLLVVERQIRNANPELVLCYVTTGYLYGKTSGESIPPLFSLREVPDFSRRGAFHEVPGNKLYYGILGDLLPLFRSRDVLAQRFLGNEIVNLKQNVYNTSLETNLQDRAKSVDKAYDKTNPSTAFQKKAFEDFVALCEKADRRVILFAGQNNPIFENKLDPALRADFQDFLQQIATRHSNVILVTIAEMPVETPEDYDDLSHVNVDTQKRFSNWLADWLDKRNLVKETQVAAKK